MVWVPKGRARHDLGMLTYGLGLLWKLGHGLGSSGCDGMGVLWIPLGCWDMVWGPRWSMGQSLRSPRRAGHALWSWVAVDHGLGPQRR